MHKFDNLQIIKLLISAAGWTVTLSAVAFAGGALLGLFFTVLRVAPSRALNRAAIGYISFVQSIPLLMLLFLVFFGLPLLGVSISPWTAASVSLIIFTSAFLAEIWRGSVQAVSPGQWDAGRAMGLRFMQIMRLIIVPQAARLSLPPTVGFSVQVVKGTALTSIIGFVELTKAGTALNNATFRPFFVFFIVCLIYFALCFPLSVAARHFERRLRAAD